MPYDPTERQMRCRFCINYCGPNEDQSMCCHGEPEVSVTPETCESCESYESAYIEYPLTVTGIDNERIGWHRGFHEPLAPVAIRPCDDECAGKTYLGFYLGEFPAEIHTSWNKDTGVLSNVALSNPAIYVPELERVVWGYESWWRGIDDPSELSAVTDTDISNCWYVRALESLIEKGEE